MDSDKSDKSDKIMRAQLSWQSSRLLIYWSGVRIPLPVPSKSTLVSTAGRTDRQDQDKVQIQTSVLLNGSVGIQCNGSTADFDSVSLGSNPSIPAKKLWHFSIVGLMRCPVTAEIRGSNPLSVASFIAQQISRQISGLLIRVSVVRSHPVEPFL